MRRIRRNGIISRSVSRQINEKGLRRLGARQDFAPGVLSAAAAIIRRFIEEYHEKSEEESLFPRFEKAGKLVDLVAVLRRQHQAGRRLTAEIEFGIYERPASRRTCADERGSYFPLAANRGAAAE